MVGGLALDILTRVINVHWAGGAVFVAAEGGGNLYYLNTAKTNKDGLPSWENLGKFIDTDGTDDPFFHVGSAHGLVGEAKTSTFVVVSYGGGTLGTGAIFASQDGLAWSKVFTLSKEQPDRNTSATMFGVVWDGSAFWAGAHQSIDVTFDDPRLSEIDILLTSSDGLRWQEVGRHVTVVDTSDPAGVPPEYTRGLLADHCSNRVVDSLGNGLPDGFYGYDPDRELLIKPKGLPAIDYYFGGVVYGNPSGVTIQNSGAGTIPSNPGLPTSCVARSGGHWVAAGGTSGPMAAILVPDPTTESQFIWRRIDPPSGSDAITTIVAGEQRAGQ
jgi:hypothetical protein